MEESMLEEQKNTICTFRNSFFNFKVGDIVIYGTGINAEAVVKNCVDIPIVGLMDAAKTGQQMWGLTVLSEAEIVQKGVKTIVIVARPTVVDIIYKRIEKWALENGITVYDIEGNDVGKRQNSSVIELPYYEVSYEDLLSQIDQHEVISFDIFDTVLHRRIYEPADVFFLVDKMLGDRFLFVFSKERQLAEREVSNVKDANIYEIYDLVRERNNLSEAETHEIMQMELEMEKRVLTVRKKMKECIKYCVDNKKTIYFLSDMYLPKEIIEGFFREFEIKGYADILVSCEYRCTKETGLFELLKKKEFGRKILHIGDNEKADYIAAINSGISAFRIMSAKQMLENSTYRSVLVHLSNLESRVMAGMFATEVFDNPFALYQSKGKPLILSEEDFGYLIIAPLVVAFIVWLDKAMEKQQDGLLLFAARDGWIFRSIYHIISQRKDNQNIQDMYFMTSRYSLDLLEDDLKSGNANAYKQYLDALDLKKYKKIYFVDFMSRGTCQSKLEELLDVKMHGLYVQRSFCGDLSKDSVEADAYFKETSAFGNNRRIFALCDFLECIMTSYEASFKGIALNGEYVYDEERRSKQQLSSIKQIHEGILDFGKQFATIMKGSCLENIKVDFVDEILKYTSEKYSNIKVDGLREFYLDDYLQGDKNTGNDALQ